jgi:hypothetical protein
VRGKRRTWTDEAFVQAVAKHTNFTDVLRELGLRPAGGNHASMKRHAARLSLDTSHFNGVRRVRGLEVWREFKRRTDDEIFRERSAVSSNVVRKHARRLIPPSGCAICGNAGEWQGRALTLQLDHANGRYDDNRLENLRWLCPNCHSQTPNFAGRGKPRRVREAPAFYLARALPRRCASRRPLAR